MRDDRSTPKNLAAIDRARKLLAVAYSKGVSVGERENALSLAKKALVPTGLSIEDLKEQSTPSYLTGKGGPSVVGGYSQAGANTMARMLKKGGWTAQNPADHGYKDYRGNYADAEEPGPQAPHDPRRFSKR